MVGVVGGDQYGGNMTGEVLAQLGDDLQAGDAVIQMQIHNNHIHALPFEGFECAVVIGGQHHIALPLAEQRAHAVQDCRFVINYQNTQAR